MSTADFAERHLARFSKHFCPRRRTNAGVWVFNFRHFKRLVCASCLFAGLLIAGCGSAPKKPVAPPTGKPGGYYLDDGPGANAPANLDAIPDAVPRNEPFHKGANKPYTVFGKTYVPIVSNERFKQKGVASWYGRKFHGQKTSNGETYDMYAMSAAHPTLPLPCYVRVTNTVNGKSVVVRVNDRGPFLSERIIDLSFAAANRIDIARRGSGQVIVERVFPGEKANVPEPEAPPSKAVSVPVLPSVPPPEEEPIAVSALGAPLAAVPLASPPNTIAASPITADAGALFLQLGAFSSRDNAEIFRARMQGELDWNREPISLSQSGNLYRVRLGPYKSRAEAEAIAEQVKASLNFMPIIAKP